MLGSLVAFICIAFGLGAWGLDVGLFAPAQPLEIGVEAKRGPWCNADWQTIWQTYIGAYCL